MNIQVGDLSYEWIGNWAKLPATTGWAHHGLIVADDGTIVTGHASEPKVLILDTEGNLLREVAVPVTETHGISLSGCGDDQYLWIADTGSKYGAEPVGPPRVIKCSMTGDVLASLEKRDFDYADDDAFCPTAVAIDTVSGKVWITDGYGSSKIHRFSADLKRELTLTGEEGAAGRFKCPHWIHIDQRSGRPLLYVADRGNNRIQVFDSDGNYVKVIDEGLVTPSAFGAFGDYLVVAELNARLVILDGTDSIVGAIGEGRKYLERPGWPNRKAAAGPVTSPLDDIDPFTFNSPHGMSADADGNIYVSEWLIGDRFTKLRRL